MFIDILVYWKSFNRLIRQILKIWTKPAAALLVASTLSDINRSRTDLIVENAMLRQQRIVLNRQVKRPQLNQRDRILLVILARCTRFWQQTLHIVQPDTLLRWHRELFRLYWRRKSRMRKPRISHETIALIKKMAKENRLWGAERIRGELLKLGIRVSKRTIQSYIPKKRKVSGQTWATFIKNHADDIWACDFTVVHDLFLRPIYIFVILELKTRRVVHAAVTALPTDAWTAQQLREATPWDRGPRYLIRDRDRKYGTRFSSVAASTGIKELKTPYRAPKANAFCERFMESLKRECLDHMLIMSQQRLRRLVREYVSYYNDVRPHQGIHQRIPGRYDEKDFPSQSGKIMTEPILGGLHHDYTRIGYLS